MNPEQLPLRDIHLPTEVAWWPPAVGWWLLAGLLILLAVILGLIYRRYRRAAPRRVLRKAAFAEWTRIATEFSQSGDAVKLVRELSILLRRVCLGLYPRVQVAGLIGADWLQFLDQPLGTQEFSQGIGQQLERVPYQAGTAPNDPEALLALGKRWLQRVCG